MIRKKLSSYLALAVLGAPFRNNRVRCETTKRKYYLHPTNHGIEESMTGTELRKTGRDVILYNRI